MSSYWISQGNRWLHCCSTDIWPWFFYCISWFALYGSIMCQTLYVSPLYSVFDDKYTCIIITLFLSLKLMRFHLPRLSWYCQILGFTGKPLDYFASDWHFIGGNDAFVCPDFRQNVGKHWVLSEIRWVILAFNWHFIGVHGQSLGKYRGLLAKLSPMLANIGFHLETLGIPFGSIGVYWQSIGNPLEQSHLPRLS